MFLLLIILRDNLGHIFFDKYMIIVYLKKWGGVCHIKIMSLNKFHNIMVGTINILDMLKSNLYKINTFIH